MRWYLGPLVLALAACGGDDEVRSPAADPQGHVDAAAPQSAPAAEPDDDAATAEDAGTAPMAEPTVPVPIAIRARVVDVDTAGRKVTLAEIDAPAGATPRELPVEEDARNGIATLSQGDEVMATCRTALGATQSQPAGLPDCMAVVSIASAGPIPETVPGG
jgi:hypothetical protein